VLCRGPARPDERHTPAVPILPIGKTLDTEACAVPILPIGKTLDTEACAFFHLKKFAGFDKNAKNSVYSIFLSVVFFRPIVLYFNMLLLSKIKTGEYWI